MALRSDGFQVPGKVGKATSPSENEMVSIAGQRESCAANASAAEEIARAEEDAFSLTSHLWARS